MVNMNSDLKSGLGHMPAPGTDATREQISRWLDGDIEPHEIEHAMAALSREEGRYCWAEMHFVGDCIRGLESTRSGCAESIRAAIAAEPAILAPAGKRLRVAAQAKERSLSSAMAYIGKGGRAWVTAAAVAAVGFVGTVVYKDQVNAPQVASVAPPASVTSVAATPVLRPEFNAYLQAHQESADISSLSPMRQYLRPAAITQGQ
jgi:negative regulator of sigma E activity